MPIQKVLAPAMYDTRMRAPVKVWTKDVEAAAENQLIELASLPFIHSHIASMPDVHMGIGAPVGTVLATKSAIVPAAVGVDIGCGMMALKLSVRADQLPDSLAAMRSAIEAVVPHGRSDGGGAGDTGAWDRTPGAVSEAIQRMPHLHSLIDAQHATYLDRAYSRADRQLGTLGTGNHFVEVCVDKDDFVWIMLHSGSRGIGNAIGRYFIDLAKEEMVNWHIPLANKDLAYLPESSPLFRNYWAAVGWAQEYARVNREIMMKHTLEAFGRTVGVSFTCDAQAINCHHNYVAIENHHGQNVYVTRKGAVRARVGDLGIIPGSMGARSFIVRGLGNPDSFCSCSHGAGRKMSRTEAAKTFSLQDLADQTYGVECRKDAGVIDEAPGSYKDIGKVMADQDDLVEIVAELKQVVCVKG